jgi:hypothetical protein
MSTFVIPVFESEFLSELAEAFRKRRKSLKHRGSEPEVYKIYQQQRDNISERLEIVLEDGTQRNGAILRLKATPDRCIVVGARRKARGEAAWSWEYDGKLLGSYSGRDAIGALEEAIALLPRIEASNLESLATPWVRLLARGPREL